VTHLDGLIIDVEEGEEGRYRITSDGRRQYEAKITLSEEGFQRLVEGYLCGRCLEDLTPLGAFPEKCPVCGFHVRELQPRQIERDFVGHELLGSQLSLSDEITRLGDTMWKPGDPI
jgi:hypothetical protein